MPELKEASTKELLNELRSRGGTLAAVAEAQLLVLSKSLDYNGREEAGSARDAYFPHGVKSYSQMLWTKALRFRSLAENDASPRFEGLRDTALDIINYASFYVDWSNREERLCQLPKKEAEQ